MRVIPKVSFADPPSDYARLAAQGWDTVQEALELKLTPRFVDLLEKGRAAAEAASDSGNGVVLTELGDGQVFKIHASGAKAGFRWRLSNDDLIFLIASPKRQWSVSVRYSSAGLWEHGWQALRVRAFDALRPFTAQASPDCIRVSRADWCFDFYSPPFKDEFSAGLLANVVAHSSVKAAEEGAYSAWFRGQHGQTLTIGKKSGLQVQLYDKTREIDEASGKTWLYGVWRANLGFDPWTDGARPADVWRLESRYSGAFLKERNLRRPFEVQSALSELLAESLLKRRLTGDPQGIDMRRDRRPLHPLWTLAYLASGEAREMCPLGRKVTGRRDALVKQDELQIAGTMRSAVIRAFKSYDASRAHALAMRALRDIEADTGHVRKCQLAMDRNSDLEEAR